MSRWCFALVFVLLCLTYSSSDPEPVEPDQTISGNIYKGKYGLFGNLRGCEWFDVDGNGKVELLTIEKSKGKHEWGWDCDWFTLVIEANEDKEFKEYREDFNSSYGMYKVEIRDLFSDGKADIFLTHGHGRGTCVREEFLEVKTWNKGKLKKIFSKA